MSHATLKRPVCVSLACWPATSQTEALQACVNLDGTSPLSEPLWGPLSAAHVQLVPQSRGQIDEALAADLREHYPHTQFRLHANARVQSVHRIIDLADFAREDARAWFHDAARISRALRAPAYSAHSGRRSAGNLATVWEAARRLSDWFECPVAIEGQYPTADGSLLIDSWEEYRQLFESGLPYALDLSHLHILAARSGRQEHGLVADMLASERCLEIHVSSNDGSSDQHRICARPSDPPWWLDLLAHANPQAVIFSEGNHRHRAHGGTSSKHRLGPRSPAQHLDQATSGLQPISSKERVACAASSQPSSSGSSATNRYRPPASR